MHVCPLLLSFRLTLSGAQTLQSVRATYLQIYHQWVHLPLPTSQLAGRTGTRTPVSTRHETCRSLCHCARSSEYNLFFCCSTTPSCRGSSLCPFHARLTEKGSNATDHLIASVADRQETSSRITRIRHYPAVLCSPNTPCALLAHCCPGQATPPVYMMFRVWRGLG
jgi:hypothetical protein